MGKGKLGGLAVIVASSLILTPSALYASTLGVGGEDPISYSGSEPDYQEDIFPESAVLRPNVKFWLDVYTKYDENEAIIHDSVNLDIRYEVVNLDEAYPRSSRRYMARQLTLRKRQIADTLGRLARQEGRCNGVEECRIAALFANTADAGRYRDAADQLRVQYGLKSRFRQGLITSGQYMPEMRKIFERYGVPLDLLALPHVESSFNVKAYSRVGAAGIWQFMRSTGRRYMKINSHTDERRDPIIATEGAAKFLRDNWEELGSWPLVVTSYNHGRNGMAHAKRIYGDNIAAIIQNYDGRAFGFASRNFYCEFLAARRIMQHPERYFGNIDFHSPLEFEVVKAPYYVHIRELARHYDIKEITRLNPALHKGILAGHTPIPPGYALRVPPGTAGLIASAVSYTPTPDELAQAPAPRAARRAARDHKDHGAVAPGGEYVVDSGDSLFSIAMKFHTTVAALKELNDIGHRGRINPGQKLILSAEAAPAAPPAPAVQSVAAPAAAQAAPGNPPQAVNAAEARNRPNDGGRSSVVADYSALFTYMANRVAALIGGNNAAPPVQAASAAPAVTAAAAAPPVPPQPVSHQAPLPGKDKFRFINTADGYGVISALPEETLAHYAGWAGVSAREIMRLNKWRRPTVHLWRTVKIPLGKTSADAFELRRQDFHNGVYKDFFDRHSVKEVGDRVLLRGQSAWMFCNVEQEVPLWLLSLYNEGKQLDRLHAGEILRVPVVEKKSS